MSIITEIAITVLAAAIVALLLFKFYTFMLTPVKLRCGTDMWTVLRIEGDCPDIEQTVDGLLWLSNNGILKSSILIVDCGVNSETLAMVRAVVKKHSEITFCDLDGLETLLGEKQ